MIQEELDTVHDAAETATDRYLTFCLDQEFYAIAFERVWKILLTPTLTAATAAMPDYIRGMLDFAGEPVPVADMRKRFGIRSGAVTDPCVIVVEAALPTGGRGKVGLLVDDVEDMIEIPPWQVHKPVDFGVERRADYIVGMARVNGHLDTILDLDCVTAAPPKPDLEPSS